MQANIFRTKKEYYPDRAGLQATLYFSGCGMRCVWCREQMPDGADTELIWDSSRCLYCHICEQVCPTGALAFAGSRLTYDAGLCARCHKCVANCPARMLNFSGSRISLEEAKAIVLKDFHSCNETMDLCFSNAYSQEDVAFSRELMHFCRENAIHTTVETTGFLTDLEFSRLIQYADRVVIDLKHYDDRKHVQYTGVSNRQILANLDLVVSCVPDRMCRIGLIPGFNDAVCDAAAFGKLFAEHGVRNIWLTRYVTLCDHKYEGLRSRQCPENDEVPFDGVSFMKSAVTDRDLERYAEILRRYGMRVHSTLPGLRARIPSENGQASSM
jgi:pyruvate formate lyase activating enzyme